MLKLSKALCALLALCLLASTSLAEEEGLVAFQEESTAYAFTPWWTPPSPKRL